MSKLQFDWLHCFTYSQIYGRIIIIQHLQPLMIDNQNFITHSKSVIKFYDPYIKLQFRASVEDLFLKTLDNINAFAGVDIAAILDAVLKRGGITKAQQRIQEIYLSLPYYTDAMINYCLNLVSKIPAYILAELSKQATVTQQPFIEQHLLPHGHSAVSINLDEQCFLQENYHTADQYLCLKTLAYFGCQLNRLNNRFKPGYHKLRKWLYIQDTLMEINPMIQPKYQSTQKTNEKQQSKSHSSKVCIVGINLPNVIMTLKLRKLGLNAKIVDTNKDNILKWSKGYVPDTIKQGAFLCTQQQSKELHELLSAHLSISVEPINSQRSTSSSHTQSQSFQPPPVSSNNQSDILDPLAKHEQSYMALLEEILREWPVNASKLLWDEMQCKAIAYNGTNMDYRFRTKFGSFDKIDVEGLRIYNERVLMLNRIKDEASATVSDVRKCIMGRTLGTKLSNLNNNHTEAYMLKSEKLKPKILNQLLHKPKLSIKTKLEFSSVNPQHDPPSDSSSDSSLGFLFQENFAIINPNEVLTKLKYDNKNKVWTATCRQIDPIQGKQKQANKDIVETFDYLIYTPTNNNTDNPDLFQAYENSDCQINLDCFGNVNTQLNCLYKLQEKVVFRGADNRTDSRKLTYACFSGQFGIVHFYVCQDGLHVLACLSCFQNKTKGAEKSNMEYYKQIEDILTNFVLKKGTKIEQPVEAYNENMQISEYYLAKDKTHQSVLIRQNQSCNMFISAPIIVNSLNENFSNNNSNNPAKMDYFNRSPLQAHLEVNRKILHFIVNSIQASTQAQGKRKILEVSSAKSLTSMKQIVVEKQNDVIVDEKQLVQEKQVLGNQKPEQKQMVDVDKSIPNRTIGYDLFGFSAGFVQEYKKVILKCYHEIKLAIEELKPSCQRMPIYRRIPELPLINQSNYPMLLSPEPSSGFLLLHNIGLPHLNHPHDHMVGFRSSRAGHSLQNDDSSNSDGQIALFYHTCLEINQIVYYCMAEFQIPQRQSKTNFIIDVVLAHPDYSVLNQTVLEHYGKNARQQLNLNQDQLRTLQQNMTQIDYDYFDYCLQQQYVKSLPKDSSACTERLIQQLEQLGQQPKIPMPMTISTAVSLLAEVNKFVQLYCKLYRIREYTIADLFAGKLNYNFIQYETNIKQKGQSLENLYLSQIITTRYPLRLIEDSQNPNLITIERKFMIRRQQTFNEQFAQNGIYRLMTTKSILCYESHNSTHPTNKSIRPADDCWNWLLQIIQKLLKDKQDKKKGSSRQVNRKIVRELKYLASQQINNFVILVNSLRQNIMNSTLSYEIYCYVVLTRLQHGPSPTIDKNKVQNLFLETSASSNDENKLTQTQIQQLGWMIDEGHAVGDDSWFIICNQ